MKSRLNKSWFFLAGLTSVLFATRAFPLPPSSAVNVMTIQSENVIGAIALRGVVTTLAGNADNKGGRDGIGSDARFNSPYGVALDSSGNLYVGDSNNQTIRKVTPTGVVTTVAGSAGKTGSNDGVGSAAKFNLPRRLAVDVDGNIYVADSLNDTIRKITPSRIVTTVAGTTGKVGSNDGVGGAALFSGPGSVAVDASDNLYVTDFKNNTIRKITADGVVTTLAGNASKAGSDDGTGSAALFNNPSSIALDSSGNLYVTDHGNHTIRKITPDGTVTTLAGSAGNKGSNDGMGTAARFNSPNGIAVDSKGNVYVADTSNQTIRKITPDGAVTTLAGSAGNVGSTDGTGTAARFNYPCGLAVDANGTVYVADQGNNTIRKIQQAGW